MDHTEKFNVLGQQPVGRLLLQYAVPAIVAMTASSLYNIIDGMFIGQGVGQEAIVGLAVCAPIMLILAAFGAMVGVGASTLMSVRLGQKDYQTARHILGNVVIMNVIMGLSLGMLFQLVLKPLLRFFGASDAIMPYAYDFMTIILCGNVVTHLYLGLNALLRSTNRPMTAMYATIGTVVLNCLFAPLFIFVLGWGIRGAALATVLAQTSMLVWQLRFFSRPDEFVRFSRDILHLDRRIVRESLLIGLPPFLINFCACAVAIIYTRSMAGFGGDVAVGAYGICNRLVLFVVMVVIGLNQGMQPIAGYNYGARKFDRVLRVLRLAVIAATCITTLGFVVYTFFARECVMLFVSDSEPLIAESVRGLRILVTFFPLIGMQIVSTSFFQSIGMAGKSILLSLTRQLIFLIPALLLLPHVVDDPVAGVWWSAPLSDGLACIVSAVLLTIEVRKFRRRSAEVQVAHSM